MTNWFPPTKCDQLLLEYWDHYKPQLPISFARSVLCLIFRKPKSAKDRINARKWNTANAQDIMRRHKESLGSYTNSLRAALEYAENLALERWEIMQKMGQEIAEARSMNPK